MKLKTRSNVPLVIVIKESISILRGKIPSSERGQPKAEAPNGDMSTDESICSLRTRDHLLAVHASLGGEDAAGEIISRIRWETFILRCCTLGADIINIRSFHVSPNR